MPEARRHRLAQQVRVQVLPECWLLGRLACSGAPALVQEPERWTGRSGLRELADRHVPLGLVRECLPEPERVYTQALAAEWQQA
jgi:hypothetical protein